MGSSSSKTYGKSVFASTGKAGENGAGRSMVQQPKKPELTEPEPDQEPVSGDLGPELDLCFLCDCTGSMGEYIAAAQQHIREIVERVASSERANVRFALISYRDHPPQDYTYITNTFPFTEDVGAMRGYVDSMEAEGGGDGPEAVTAALDDALQASWRKAATKVAVLIADAPPHGLEPDGDGFPDGDPMGRDPLEIARRMAAESITLYAVGCEPALGEYSFARDFMCSLAEITGGQAIALSSAALLAEVIVNGSAEEISMTRLQREVEQEVEQVRHEACARAEALDDSECAHRAWTRLQFRQVISKQMRTDGAMKNAHHEIWHKSGGSAPATLASAKAELCEAEPRRGMVASSFGGTPPTESCMVASSFGMKASSGRRKSRRSFGMAACSSSRDGGAGWARRACERAEDVPAAPVIATSCSAVEDVITEEQVSRLMKRRACKS
jgi:hypothetical protein